MRKRESKSLRLSRETLRNLSSAQELRAVRGGNETYTCTSCLIAGCGCSPGGGGSEPCEEHQNP